MPASGGMSEGVTGGLDIELGDAAKGMVEIGGVEEEWEKEASYLQGLVERLQDKVDKEVARGIKVCHPTERVWVRCLGRKGVQTDRWKIR